MDYTKRVKLPLEKPKKPFAYDTLKYDIKTDDRFLTYSVFGGLLGGWVAWSIGSLIGWVVFGSAVVFFVASPLIWALAFFAVRLAYKNTEKYMAWNETQEYIKVCFAYLPDDTQNRLKPVYADIVEGGSRYGDAPITREVIRMAESMYAHVTEPIRQHAKEVENDRRQERYDALAYMMECNKSLSEIIDSLG